MLTNLTIFTVTFDLPQGPPEAQDPGAANPSPHTIVPVPLIIF